MDFMDFGVLGVGTITVLCYLIGQIVKASGLNNKWIPVICGAAGLLLGVMCLYIGVPDFPAADPVTAAAVGVVSGLAATGLNEAAKQIKEG